MRNPGMVVPINRKKLRQKLALNQFTKGELPIQSFPNARAKEYDAKQRFRLWAKGGDPLKFSQPALFDSVIHKARLEALKKQKKPKLP